jgi:hypothetical protein
MQFLGLKYLLRSFRKTPSSGSIRRRYLGAKKIPNPTIKRRLFKNNFMSELGHLGPFTNESEQKIERKKLTTVLHTVKSGTCKGLKGQWQQRQFSM